MDGPTSNHIFDNCILQMLSDKIVILTTHKLDHLKNVENMVLMKDGSIVISGNYRDVVMPKSEDFQDINLAKENAAPSSSNQMSTPEVQVKKMSNADNIR